jgi:hypothetical protein
MVLLIIFLTFVAIVSALLYKKFARMLTLASKLNGPFALPLLGNGLLFLNKTPPGSSLPKKKFMK